MYASPRIAPPSWTSADMPVCSFHDDLTSSPCNTCKHMGSMPADQCIERKDCPLNPPKEPIFCFEAPKYYHTNKPKKNAIWHECPFESCTRKTTKEVCWTHKATYQRRLKMGLSGADLFVEGHNRPGKVTKRKRCAFPGCKKFVKINKNEGQFSYDRRECCSLSCAGKLQYLRAKENKK